MMDKQQEFLYQCIQELQSKFKYKDELQIYISNVKVEFTIYSCKQKLGYALGIFNQELFIGAPIYRPCYPVFRLMNDEFWLKMLEINRFAKFRFAQNAVFDQCIQSKFNRVHAKSSIFELIKVFVLAEEYQQNSVDIGCFEVVFGTRKFDEKLMNDVVNALNILYFLNKELAKKCTDQFVSRNYLDGMILSN